MRRCLKCSKDYDDQVSFCAVDGNYTLSLVLNGKYSIEKEIGRGGMGIVYQATQMFLKKQVALKVLPPGVQRDLDSEKRFLREARLTAQLSHKNAITLHDYDVTSEGVSFFVMELLKGQNLRAFLAQGRPVEQDVAKILEQICAAIEEGHSQGILHRDLKPENVFLEGKDANSVKVLDFGLAKLLQPSSYSLSDPAAFLGTPVYMSPEQCSGTEGLDERTDVYSLGVLLYEMLAGTPPFAMPNLLAIVNAHLSLSPPSLRGARPDISEEVERVVLKALEKVPGKRQKSALQLAQEFCDALGLNIETFAPTLKASAQLPDSPGPGPIETVKDERQIQIVKDERTGIFAEGNAKVSIGGDAAGRDIHK